MFHLFFALFLAFASPAHHTNNNCHNGTVTTQDDGRGPGPGGDGGHINPGD